MKTNIFALQIAMRRNLHIAVIFLLSGFFHILSGNGWETYNFTRIDADAGLSHNQVHAIFKDSRGFMWFGTNFGLNRFDGYSFKVFRHIPSDTTSLTDNRIRGIFEGPGGKLWISMVDTFLIYDPITESFSGDDEIFHRATKIPVGAIDNILKDNIGNTWMISDTKGLFVYIPGSDSIRHFPLLGGPSGVQNRIVSYLASDSKGNVWLIGVNGLLEKLDMRSGKVTFRTDFLSKVFPKGKSLRLYIDADDDIWLYSVNSDEGVVIYSPETGKYKHYHVESPQYKISNDIINSIVQDNQGIIWLATDHGGINLVDKLNDRVKVLLSNPEDPRSVSQNSINTLFKDNTGIIWAGTFKKGVCYYHKNLYKFQLFQHRENDPGSLPFDDVNAFQEDKAGNLWIGTNGNGLVYFDRSRNKHTIYQHKPGDRNSLSHNVIVSMLYDSNDQLWIGTFYGGLNKFDGTKFTHFRHNPADSSSLSNDRVWELYEDSQGQIWIGTLGSGIDQFDPKTGVFKHYPAGKVNSIHSDFILHITEDENTNLWIGTANGLEKYIRDEERFVSHLHDVYDSTSLSHNVVSSVQVDSRGLIWAATQEGLSVYDRGKQEFYRYYVEDGLPDNTILAVIEDNKGEIWASSIKGISNIRVMGYEGNKPVLSFKNYSEADGLQGNEFNEGVAFKTSKGELVFGGPDGFNLFDPSGLTFNDTPPVVAFTDFQIFNKSISVGKLINGRILLTDPINQTRHLVLKHSEDIISIEFSALNYIHPEKNKFQYILEGFNREWMQVDAGERKVTYTNLDPGEYIFRVKASNNDGVWNEQGISLAILVRPPIWKSKGAILFYFLFLLSSLVLLRYLILFRERSKFMHEQEKLEAKRLHELDLLKIRFFTNVSHEFRTPLSLIISPLEKMLKNSGDQEQTKHLKLIYRNARRLLNLVNQLLDFRRMEVQKIQLKPVYGDIVNFISEIYKTFTDLAEKKSIQFDFNADQGNFFCYFDHDKVEKIVFNLLSNAFKFTPEGKSIEISLKIVDLPDSGFPLGKAIQLRVTDTGMGMSPDALNKIFDRFFSDSPGGVMSQGSGIGLSLTKDFVDLHQGNIKVESNLGEGSSFIVHLPVISEAPEVVEETPKEISEPLELSVSGEEESEEIKPVKHNATVLIVEDNDDFRFYIKDNLKVSYTILEAPNGKLGLEVANAQLPDLIVSDVMMPEMDGFELCRQIKSSKSTSHIPVILLTARMAESKRMEGFDTGADDYITKPFSFELLESRITNLLRQRERIKSSFQKHFSIEPGEIAITSLDEKLINKALELVEQHMNDPEFSVEKLSRELGMSRVHLYKKLTALTGKTPIEFIRIMRLKRAAQLLQKSQLTIAEVAYEVGFNDPRYFSRYFKTEFGMLPSQYVNSRKDG